MTVDETLHWQLRSLVSSPSPGLLYYPEDHFVYCLNTNTRRQKLITCLPFSPRCLAVKYGWLCAGGADNGQFTALKLSGARHEDAFDQESSLGLEDPWRGRPNSSWQSSREPGDPTITAANTDDSRNNDNTVRIFSLSQLTVIATLELEVAVNHATISPDGQHLVAVGDSQDVYFYKLTESSSRSLDPNHRWEGCFNPPLRAGTDALFSTAFSPSSQLCAVASQDGTVTIFDMRYIDSPKHNPIIRTIPSSRPGTNAGAVRSISFSPDPWDLLVWTEHCGRICVLDARNDFRSRQLIDLSAEADTIERAEVLCFPSEDLREPQLRQGRVNPAIVQSIYRQVGQAHLAEHAIRELSSGNEDYLYNDPVLNRYTPGTASRDGLSSDQRPTSISYLPPPSAARGLSTSLRDYIRERSLQRDRDLLRHDSSRYLADARNDPNITETTSVNNSQRSQSQTDSTDPWQTIEAAMTAGRLLRDREVSFEANYQRRREIWMRWEERRRERMRGLHADAGTEGYIDRYRGGTSGGDTGVNITGCSFSRDGRNLYVGTEEGIVEYHINIQERKFFPQVTFR
ncbi:hypothetical protein GP486_005571 [Trichoglossum hirsutum]|uniref:DUF2415 domain-containing protein n=1 Tax=Trichoglossum hirsutum TaxID=265104 RepID=A0A9P8L8Z9_9PEZI|nr:hypothetical protein GP486_005571 [Trichoglossum hirsutum]